MTSLASEADITERSRTRKRKAGIICQSPTRRKTIGAHSDQEISPTSLLAKADFAEREKESWGYFSIASQQKDNKRKWSSAHSARHTHRPHATFTQHTLPTGDCRSGYLSPCLLRLLHLLA